MSKITNKRAIEIINGLSESGQKTFPLKMSYAISKNLNLIENNIYKPYLKELQKLNDKYYKDGNLTNEKLYKQEVEELLSIENELEMQTISEDILEKCESDTRFNIPSLKEQSAIIEMIQ